MLAFGSKPGLAEVPETVRLAAGVSGSPIVNATGVPAFIRQLVGEIMEITGAMFAGSTVTEKVVLFDFAPVSVTQIVMAEEPAWAPAVAVTLRLEPMPLNTILAGEITAGFDEVA